ncbi:Mlc titration factor A [Variovorax sp. PBL-H6]|uniref:M90 family metallopeptidase n=1 Tax=Variovorax sp. PBL-H6 TaxID=434009 RepID=UPI0013168509|nr:M90 family metallopeptidase [Variovorax sp. PBL-H6]VTU28913.1 Mlc titration factor A [Variovorax sp. PBL-H6]
MFNWLRGLRAPPSIPDAAWQATLWRYPFLAHGAGRDAERLRRLAAEFLRDKEFHGAHGFIITDEVALAVAAQAVLPVLHLPGELRWYDDFVGIVIHPSEAVARRKTVDETGVVHEYDEILAGEAMDRGPVMLSWQDVLAGSVTQDAGYNVVIHEFAHKIDMKSGEADGCPPLPAGFAGTSTARDARLAWFAVLRPAYEDFRERTIVAERFGGQAPWLDDYGATSPGEFFAVACEAYFVNRAKLASEFAGLVALLDEFFRRPRSAA